jgi:Raf kinase inhibitor-like YbhB/YbcL family protein
MRGSWRRAASVLLVWGLLAACAQPATSVNGGSLPVLTVRSAAFDEGGDIPAKYTCDADNVSPPLAWSGAPDTTAAVAVIVTDPDAGGFVHWLTANVEPTGGLPEGVSGKPAAGTEGRNNFRQTGYGGPCPPSGTHRYEFAVYALSARLDLSAGYSQADLEQAMDGKVLASGTLTGRYQRRR